MRILWVPHAQLGRGRSRAEHLVERLAVRHEVTVLSFHVHDRRQSWRYIADLATHRTRSKGRYRELATWRFPKSPKLNSFILNAVLRHELVHRPYDAVVVSPASYHFGIPDFTFLRTQTTVICDYLDGGDWNTVSDVLYFEKMFVRSANAVLCVSRGLLSQARTLNPNSHYVPNGVELAKYQSYCASHSTIDSKRRLGIDPASYVLSIIGMTCSARLYFIDAVASLMQRGRNLVLLLVGETYLRKAIIQRARGIERAVRLVGPIPYQAVLDYFNATDLGLSVVDDIPYYHFQSPLKIFEYGAMRKPVLAAPRVHEAAAMALPFVHFCRDDADSVATAIGRIMDNGPETDFSGLQRYDWETLTQATEQVIADAVATRRTGRATPQDAA